MKRCILALAALTLLNPPPIAEAEELNARQLRKLTKQAEKAYAQGQTDLALETYERILSSLSPNDSRRGDALYAMAMSYLSPNGPARDVDRARRYLDELASQFPRHSRGLEISAARTLLGELDAAHAEVARKMAEIEAQQASFEAEREKAMAARQEAAGETQAAGGKVKNLEAQLRRVRAQLTETRAELEKKEEALQKLKDALVGRGGR